MLRLICLLFSELSNAGLQKLKLKSLSRSETFEPPSEAIRDDTGKSRNEYTELPTCECSVEIDPAIRIIYISILRYMLYVGVF